MSVMSTCETYLSYFIAKLFRYHWSTADHQLLLGEFKQTTPKSHRILLKPTADKALRQSGQFSVIRADVRFNGHHQGKVCPLVR